ncbi:MAG: 8-amino-7-oxononanoate synthase [Nitrospiraceae bacterium]|nr:8-amino-7-oxononanoate synthase [Nitrospiraceae bacterium]
MNKDIYKKLLDEQLNELGRKKLLREIMDRQGPQGAAVSVNGKTLVNFSSNDYLGLAASPRLISASMAASRDFGAGAGAARLLAGGTRLHKELEEKAAAFTGHEAALLFNSGYHANTGTIPALAGPDCTIFSDELNHASIIDGCRLSRAKTVIFRHADPEHLGRLLKAERAENERALIITESVFSMDGDIAPIEDIFGLCERYGADLYVDDAHAVGVLGAGRGSLAHFGLTPSGPAVIQMGTFSKALGSYGAFIAADIGIIGWLKNTARTFIFSTALPPSVAGASLAALEILDSGEGLSLMEKLHANRNLLYNGLSKQGFDMGDTKSPVIPVFVGGIDEAVLASKRLLDAGFYVPAIRPPTVNRARLRLQVTAAHSESHINSLLAALK